jgi:acyl carrier protein
MPDVEATVQEALRQMLGEDADKVKPDAKLRDLLQDGLDMLEFKMRLEDNLNIDLEARVFESSATVRELSSRIATALQRL